MTVSAGCAHAGRARTTRFQGCRDAHALDRRVFLVRPSGPQADASRLPPCAPPRTSPAHSRLFRPHGDLLDDSRSPTVFPVDLTTQQTRITRH